MPNYPYHPIFELTRGRITESVHFGALAVVDSSGCLVASHGDSQVTTFLRSSAKPFQAMPFLLNGGQKAYDLSPREIAIMCASHKGTDEHYAVVSAFQKKTGVKESDLLCGTHSLEDQVTEKLMAERGEELTPNRHNCSGKHTGMLAYTRLKKLPVTSSERTLPYIDPNHPIQKEILENFAEMCELSPEEIEIGIDGCSAPNFAVPLYNAALAFARLCDPQTLDAKRAEVCRTITASMTSNPFMVGGPDSFDTRLMQVTGGRILSKGGAEGYQALGILPGTLGPDSPGYGITIKISDGDLGAHSRAEGELGGHARPAVALEILRQLGAITPEELKALDVYGPTFPIQNWRKLEVGHARPSFTLNIER